jgi:hypothetical protein
MGNGWITRSVLASIARRWSRAWDVGKSEVDRLTGCSSDDSAPHHFRKKTVKLRDLFAIELRVEQNALDGSLQTPRKFHIDLFYQPTSKILGDLLCELFTCGPPFLSCDNVSVSLGFIT